MMVSFYLGRHLRSLEYLEDETLQEVLLLKVWSYSSLVILKGFMEIWLFLAIGNIGALEVTAQAFVTISCIYYHDVRVLLVILAHHGVHEEALATSRRTRTKKLLLLVYFTFPSLPVVSIGIGTPWRSV